MPKQTKLHKIAAEVAKIVDAYSSTEHDITTYNNGYVEESYRIWDSIQGIWFNAKTLDEAFQKFKESRDVE